MTGVFTTENNKHRFGMGFFPEEYDDERPIPLYRRSKNFKEYIYGLQAQNADVFKRNFKSLDTYITHNRNIDDIGQSDLNRIKQEYSIRVSPIELSANNPVTICEVFIGQESEIYRKEKIESISYFTIQVRTAFRECYQEDKDKNKGKQRFIPLAIKNGFSLSRWKYTDDNKYWQATYEIDEKEYDKEVADRKLPGEVNYPFIGPKDLLEDHLIYVPYDLNGDFFHIGTFTNGDASRFLPPMKKEFYRYFDPNSLSKMLFFEEDTSGDRVAVSLIIPVRGGTITFEKAYYRDEIHDIPKEAGRIVLQETTLGIFPFYYTGNPHYDNDYRVSVLGRAVDLTFYAENSKFDTNLEEKHPFHDLKEKVSAYKRSVNIVGANSVYYDIGINFDFIELFFDYQGHRIASTLVPKWKQSPINTDKEAVFAIDFGTTNTHIACSIADRKEEALTFSKQELTVGFLHVLGKGEGGKSEYEKYDVVPINSTVSGMLRHEFVPAVIGIDDPDPKIKGRRKKYAFPVRSILIEDPNFGIKDGKARNVLQSLNIDFAFGIHQFEGVESTIIENLKWKFDGKQINEERIKGFIKQLLLLIRTKVILNGISPAKTKIIWFYPLSVTTPHLGMLSNFWKDQYKIMFGGTPIDQMIFPINESEAPYYYYNNSPASIGAMDKILSIDIGGGTSDVVYMRNGEIRLGTSFIFGGNALFGNGFAGAGVHNGIAKYFQKIFEEKFTGKSADRELEIKRIHDEFIKKKLSSESIISFFFSIKQFDFTKLLISDKEFKFSLLLHFAAIIWHTAQWLKVAANKKGDITIPSKILLSGNGSKLIEVITNGRVTPSFNALNQLVSAIFDRVFGEPPAQDISIILSENPKILTCMGGLVHGRSQPTIGRPKIFSGAKIEEDKEYYYNLQFKHLRGLYDDQVNIDEIIQTTNDLPIDKIGLAVEQLKRSVVANVADFYQFIMEQSRIIDYAYNFGITVPHKANIQHLFSEEELKKVLFQGIQELKKIGIDEGDTFNQTLFFLPITGALFELNKKIFEDKINKTTP